MTGTDAINPRTDQYCLTCYEVVELGGHQTHREEEHDGSMVPDIVSIHKDGDDYVAQQDSMGHYSPHTWMDVDDHDMCGECGAVKIEDADVPDDLRDDEDDRDDRIKSCPHCGEDVNMEATRSPNSAVSNGKCPHCNTKVSRGSWGANV